MALTKAQQTVNEGSTLTYTCTLKDEDGVVLALASINSLTLSFCNLPTSDVAESTINSRLDQNVLNANNVTVHATSGLLTWELQPEDNVIVNSALVRGVEEQHEATFKLVYSTTKKLNHVVNFFVVQLGKV